MEKQHSILLKLLFIGIFIILLYLFIDSASGYEYIPQFLYVVTPLTAGLGALWASKQYGGFSQYHGRSFLYIAIGLFLVTITEFLAVYYETVLRVLDYPMPYDYLFFPAYLFLLVGIIREVFSKNTELFSKKTKILLSIFIIVLYILYMYFVYDPELDQIQNIYNQIFRTSDIFILLAVIFMFRISTEYKKGLLARPWLYVAIGSLFCIIAGLVFSSNVIAYKSGHGPARLIDLIWVVGYLIVAYGFYGIGIVIESSYKNIILKLKVNKLLQKNKTKL